MATCRKIRQDSAEVIIVPIKKRRTEPRDGGRSDELFLLP
jgi:hypothetical protein